MKNIFSIVSVLLILSLGGCAQTATSSSSSSADSSMVQKSAAAVVNDVHSFARPSEAKVTAVNLDLDVDFDQKQLRGKAVLNVVRVPGASKLVLDTRALRINKVSWLYKNQAMPLKFALGAEDPNLGQALVIELPNSSANKLQVAVHYVTSPKASGLQWLSKEQTAGKQHPFLFTQSQAIHARSWIPIQDTPGVRVTYEATIRVPKELRAVMSASNETTSKKNPNGVYHFKMPQAIPAYLIALGVGDLVFEPMSDRTGIFAEPSLARAAAEEFSDTEEMLRISEELYGPYRWGRYDLLILPPSFPFGGMENPRLSFITPTVISGDKSLVSLIAHELAHSWSGNLITNATWRDLWLNEGFTSFLTTRIMEAVYGKDRANMEYYLDYQSIVEEVAGLPPEDQILAIDLTGRDPDDVFSSIPYTKGQMFLGWLELEFGREKFDEFLRNYFDAFSFQSISTDQFLAYIDTHLLEPNPGVVTKQQINEWVFGGGLPSAAMVPESDAFDRVSQMSSSWLSGRQQLTELKTDSWSVHEWLYFLNNLPANLSNEQLNSLDSVFGLTRSTNNEIVHSWMKHVIRHDYRAGFARLEEYLVGIGRRKLIVPLYSDLMNTPKHQAFAERVYQRARSGYHPLAQGTVDAILAKTKEGGSQ